MTKKSKRFIVTAFYGESCSLFHVMDNRVKEEDGPHVIQTFRSRAEAQKLADDLNGPQGILVLARLIEELLNK